MIHKQETILKCPFSQGRVQMEVSNSDKNYVPVNSIVREIWGKSDVILFIFAGSAAEFALHKSVDWLFFTGKLPNDPLGRMFSTVDYARKIVFATEEGAQKAIDTIHQIHASVEKKRGYKISDWAYRDVLSMLMFYSIASYELVERTLKLEEKQEVYRVFSDVGRRMGIQNIPENFEQWQLARQKDLVENYEKSAYTDRLFQNYRKHLGAIRYPILIESQKMLCPKIVKAKLQFSDIAYLSPSVPVYKWTKILKMDGWIKELLLPNAFKKQISELDLYSK